MSKQGTRNKWLIFKVVLLTLVLIAAIAGIVVSGIFLFKEGITLPFGALFLISIGVIPWTVMQMVKLNGAWKMRMIEDIRSGVVEHKFSWEIEKNDWQEYITWRKKLAKEEVFVIRLWSIILAVVIFLFMFYASMELMQWILVSVFGGVAFGVLVGILFGWGLQVRIRQLNASPSGQVIFTDNAFLINDLLVFFDQMGAHLYALKVTEENDRKVILVTIETIAGERRNTADYYIPLPSESDAIATEVEAYYNGKLE